VVSAPPGERAPSTETPAPIALTLDAAASGERLDRVLAALVPSVSRATLQRWIEEGRVTVDGAKVRGSAKARAGQRVVITPAPAPPSDAQPEDIPLVVLFEDADLLVVDKPAGLVVHPAAGHPGGTLVNAVLHHTRAARMTVDVPSDDIDDEELDAPPTGDTQRDPAVAWGEGAVTRPGIVHRLDKDTSGVMVVAKTVRARDGLVQTFAAHALERRYLAIATGAPPDTITYDTLHARHATDRQRFTTRTLRGKRAVTRVAVRERLHGAALVSCRLETGRTHQIRVHLADAGFPLLGDRVYGKSPRDLRVRAAGEALGRQALHAALLAFAHPVTGAPLRFESEPPADFAAALTALREGAAISR
jgi:23S rRNA pseudouridine1911/1915/1917 synthase